MAEFIQMPSGIPNGSRYINVEHIVSVVELNGYTRINMIYGGVIDTPLSAEAIFYQQPRILL